MESSAMLRTGEAIAEACALMCELASFGTRHIDAICLSRNGIENGVDHPRRLILVEGPGDVDILRYHNTRGDVAPAQELECSGPQDGAQGGVDARHRPAL